MSLQVYGNYTPETAYSGGISKEKSATKEAKQYSSAADYAQALSQKYDCVKNGSVAISASYLSKCANDPEEASKLEENLSLFKDISQHAYESAKRTAESNGGKLTNFSHTWSIDGEGNITMIGYSTVVVDNGNKKSWKELNEERLERLKVKKEEAAKLEEKRAEKKEQEARLKGEKASPQTYKIKVSGNDVWKLADEMTKAISRSVASGTTALDIKA